jgi:hypothetical protein
MVVVELIGIPFRYWSCVVILVLPATAVRGLVWTLMEQGSIPTLRNRKHERKTRRIIVSVSFAGMCLPALRATHVDPVKALRTE